MRAYLLLVKLPYAAEYLEKEIGMLAMRLPTGSKRVLYAAEIIGFLMPQETIAEIAKMRLGDVMNNFSDWWIIGLDGQLVSKNRSMDPFRHWMNEHGGGGIQGDLKPHKPQNVKIPERRKLGIKNPVSDLIKGAPREVVLKPTPDKDRS